MQDIKWRRLLRALKNEGTILFIGPDLEKDENGNTVFTDFSQKMLKAYEGEINLDRDGFFFFIEPEAESDVVYDMKEFYETHDFGSELYRKIAAIPFHLVITLSPDDAIHNTFTDNGIAHNFEAFNHYKKEVDEPTSNHPLIYNLFGLATEGKYILTQEDYFNYLKAVLGDNVLPRKIERHLQDASNYIFLGFNFDKWYYRLLLMVLNFHANKEKKTRHAVQTAEEQDLMKQLVEQQFNITFINNNEQEFLDALYEKVDEAGMLRSLTPKLEAIKQSVREKQQLITEYEEKRDLSSDPKEKMRCDKEIEQLNQAIQELTQQLKDG